MDVHHSSYTPRGWRDVRLRKRMCPQTEPHDMSDFMVLRAVSVLVPMSIIPRRFRRCSVGPRRAVGATLPVEYNAPCLIDVY